MAEFPASPVPAEEFVEQLLPRLLGPPALAAGAAGLRARLGFVLSGKGGGAWTLVLRSKGLEVEAGADAPLTLGLSAKDWRGALWEQRGGALGAFVAEALGAGQDSPSIEGPLRFDLAVIEKLADLDATVRLAVREEGGVDWCMDLRLGAGPVAREPQVAVCATTEDLQALVSRDLEPLAAVMTGRVQVEGEMALLIQIHALLRQARS